MNDLKTLNWRLILSLGALALIRPLVRIVEDQAGVTGGPVVPIAITIGLTLLWIGVVGFSRVEQPVLTLVCAGLTYGVLSIVLSAALSPVLSGELQGPIANPAAIIPVLAVNAVWGLVAGGIALAIQRARTRG